MQQNSFFFDAEKKSNIANLSAEDEGSFINDAISKIVGLDNYDALAIEQKEYIEKSILSELTILQLKFIKNVKITFSSSGQDVKINLYDKDDNEIIKEYLSHSDKQIYFLCLLKAILKESIKDFPIFIDTPLEMLNEEYHESIIKEYYSTLSGQVVLFLTNREITSKRFKEISTNISKSYLLFSDGVNTTI